MRVDLDTLILEPDLIGMFSPATGALKIIRTTVITWILLLAIGCSSREEVFNREFKQANDRANAGEFAEAIDILVPLNEERPGYAPLVEALAFAYAGTGDHTLAAWHMIHLADLDPSQPDLRLLAAESLEQAGDPEAAIEQYRLYLKNNTQDAQAWQHLADLCRETGDTRGAVEALLARQTLDPSAATAFALGDLFRRLNNLPQAQVWYATAARQNGPEADTARLNLLELTIAEGDFQTATDLAANLKGRLSDPAQKEVLAGYQAEIDAWKGSQSSMQAARREQERLAAEVERLSKQQEAIAAANARQVEEDARATALAAEQARREAAGRKPKEVNRPAASTATGAEGRGDELVTAGNLSDAASAYWQAINADDSRPELWLKLARIYIRLQQWAEAESCVLEARRRDRRSPDIEVAYLEIVRRTQPFNQFLNEVTNARANYPQSADIALMLAEALSATGQETIRAIRAYEDFLLLAPPRDPRRKQAENTLDRLRGW